MAKQMTDENRMNLVCRHAVLHADMWAMDNERWYGSRAEYTRRLIGTAIRHMCETGLLVMHEDIDLMFDTPVDLGPVPSTWPEGNR